MRRLTADEIAAVAAELGAVPRYGAPGSAGAAGSERVAGGGAGGSAGPGGMADPVAAVAAAQQADSLAGAVAALLVAIVWGRPFDRRNAAVGVAAADLLARLNGHVLVVEPADATADVVGRVRAGHLRADAVQEWLVGRLLPDLEPDAPLVTEPVASRPPLAVRPSPTTHDAPETPARARCPWCAMPLRESLAAVVLPAGGGGGTTVGACGGCGLLLPRPHQEV